MFEIVDDDGRTPDHGYTINSPVEPSAKQLKYLKAKYVAQWPLRIFQRYNVSNNISILLNRRTLS